MIKVSKVTCPAQTTVLLVDENEAVTVIFANSIPVSLGGLSDLSNPDDRINNLSAQQQFKFAKNDKLYGYYEALSGSTIAIMLIFSQN